MSLSQEENYFQYSASLKKPEELWITKSDLIMLSLMTWIHLHIHPLCSNRDNVPCQQIFTIEWLLFFWRWQCVFAGLYCMLLCAVASITKWPSASLASLSLSISWVRLRASEAGRSFPLACLFSLLCCRGRRTVVSCVLWHPLIWCHDRIMNKCQSALMMHS